MINLFRNCKVRVLSIIEMEISDSEGENIQRKKQQTEKWKYYSTWWETKLSECSPINQL